MIFPDGEGQYARACLLLDAYRAAYRAWLEAPSIRAGQAMLDAWDALVWGHERDYPPTVLDRHPPGG